MMPIYGSRPAAPATESALFWRKICSFLTTRKYLRRTLFKMFFKSSADRFLYVFNVKHKEHIKTTIRYLKFFLNIEKILMSL
jgi:hypothetical protein